MFTNIYEQARDRAYELETERRPVQEPKTIEYFVKDPDGNLESRVYTIWADDSDMFRS